MVGMTRGELAKQLAIKLGLDIDPGAVSGFADTAGTEYDAYLAVLKDAGIITGTSSSTFDPYALASRQDAATMIGRAYDISSSASSGFSDVSSDSYAASYISGLRDAEIFNGIGGNEFGFGQEFQWSQWNLVSGSIDSYLNRPSTPDSPSTPGQIGDPSIESGGGGDTVEPEDSFAWAENYIESNFDLPGMGTWVQEMIQKYGASLSPDIINLELRTTTQFIDRFGAVMDGRAAAGFNAMSPAEILDYEDSVRSVMRASGLPPGFYDSIEDMRSLLISNVSPVEVQNRITLGFERVANAPLEIRQAYADFYGVRGDEALAAFFLDPELAVPVLERQVTAAEIAGTGRMFEISIGEQRANQLAGIGVDQRLAFTGFSRLSALAPLFQESFGESVDLTAEGEGVDAQLFGDGDAQRQINRRVEQRTSEFSGGGGAAATQGGIVGTGTA